MMNKILSFIVNEDKKLLLLKGSPNDPQFKKSFWYVVTGGYEKEDKTREHTVIREIKEETGITEINNMMYLNWIFTYNSLGVECIEYAYITFVKEDELLLNEENIDYKWCDLEEFIEKINWFGNKSELIKVLEKALENELYFKKEKIQKLNNF
jgi:dATP pyrophosphohydrolase